MSRKMEFDRISLEEWQKDKPLSILQLDAADRAVLMIADERDAIQKKTFTKWVNKHLKKANKHVGDLFEDLRDGHNLLSLLEVLAGAQLPRERGRMRFHMLQNVQISLDFLRHRQIKLVNIRAEDIVDGNPKLTLGLIWTIILHFQISDIVVGDQNMSAREALLRWCQKVTDKYPNVRVVDFTGSWRDGLAFNAVIHRHRPDLIDWWGLRQHRVRDRLENAFHVAEREYAVTKLLDPEDVDTNEPDEKSLITYVSSLYDVFPEIPPVHPLMAEELNRKMSEYHQVASQLNRWMREQLEVMRNRSFPHSLAELRSLLTESTRWRNEEVPPRQRHKNRLQQLWKEMEKMVSSDSFIEIDDELRFESLERTWSMLMTAHQDRDQILQEEINRMERLARIAEKVTREIRQTESRLDEIELRVEEESGRIDRLHPADAKHNIEQIEGDLQQVEDHIKSMLSECSVLRDGRHPQSSELTKRVQKLHQRWSSIRSLLQNKLITVLSSKSFMVEERTVTRTQRTVTEARLTDTNQQFQFLKECIDWVHTKLRELETLEFGSDLRSVQKELEDHQNEHKVIDKFQSKLDNCVSNRSLFTGEEATLYSGMLVQLQKGYSELLVLSNKRLSDLETLLDFLQSATTELIWLNEREEVELARDWSDTSLNVLEIEQYYEHLMSELERREIQFNSVVDRGEALTLQRHPASKCVEAYLAALQTQWAWLLQLTLCLETHLRHAQAYHTFFLETEECEQWIHKQEERLNTMFSQTDFSLDEGEKLLKEMQELREDLSRYGEIVNSLVSRSHEIVPLKQRSQPIRQNMTVIAICVYKQVTFGVTKQETCTLKNNLDPSKWQVVNSSGVEGELPGVCILIPPPNPEAEDAAERLRRFYDRTITLWQLKQHRLRQNMIFATIKVVLQWDFNQFMAMGKEQRDAIRKALNEDAEKLIAEGDPSDPQLHRLKEEIAKCNRLFEEYEARARREQEEGEAQRALSEQISSLSLSLDEAEKTLRSRCSAPIPRDLDTLEHLVLKHKEFETHLQSYESTLHKIQSTVKSAPRKSSIGSHQSNVDMLMKQWDMLWQTSHTYIERLKSVEITLTDMEEASNSISEFELKLASYNNMPNDIDALREVHDGLMDIQRSISTQHHIIETMRIDCKQVRPLVEKSRRRQLQNPDVDRLEEDVNKLSSRWDNLKVQVVERMRSCENASELLRQYKESLERERSWVTQVEMKMQEITCLEENLSMYNAVNERKDSVEEVNDDGERFLREAKIYSLRCEKWREALEEVHPSLDASVKRRGSSPDGAESVARELDQLNARYEAVRNALWNRLQEMTDGRIDAKPPGKLQTFRSEVLIANLNNSEYWSKTSDSVDSKASVILKSSRQMKSGSEEVKNGSLKRTGNMQFTEIRTVKRVEKREEGIATDGVGGVVDTATGLSLTLTEAIEKKVIDVRSGMYLDRQSGKRMTIEEAMEKGLVDPETGQNLTNYCGIKDPESGSQMSLLDAIGKGWYDPSRGCFVNPKTGRPVSVEEAVKLGVITREKLAMEEKYRLCDENITDMLEWLKETEKQLAEQEPLQEDNHTLRNHINTLKLIVEDIIEHRRSLATVMETVRQIVTGGEEMLSREEISSLQRNADTLQRRFESADNRADTLLKYLTSGLDDLSKIRNEISTFETWLSSAQKTLHDKENGLGDLGHLKEHADGTRSFLEDVMAHQADIRFITMSVNKFLDNSKSYLKSLNEYRGSLRLPSVSPEDSPVRQHVAELSQQFQDLLSRSKKLADRFGSVGDRQKQFAESVDKVKQWLRETEPKAQRMLAEPIGADPKAVQDQLDKVKALHNDIMMQERLINGMKQTAKVLLESVTELSPQEMASIEQTVGELTDRYNTLAENVRERSRDLETALVQSQGVQDGLDSLMAWLSNLEAHMKNIMKPASLNRERLVAQVQEHKMVEADIESHRPSVKSITQSANQLIQTSTNIRMAKKVEAKVKELTTRFEKVEERCFTRSEFLDDVSNMLETFTVNVIKFEEWYDYVFEVLSSPEISRMGPKEYSDKIHELADSRDEKRGEYEETLRVGKTVVAKKDVTDTANTKEQIKNMELAWKEICNAIDEKDRQGKTREQQRNTYESLRDEVLAWLTNYERKMDSLQAPALETEALKHQQEHLKGMNKEHRDYSTVVDKVNELGTAYDAVLRGERAESPTRRRSSVNPMKRMSISMARKSPGPSRKGSLDVRSQARLSISSIPPSRRASELVGFHLDDVTGIGQQLQEINHRYLLLGERLCDREGDLMYVRDELKRVADLARTLTMFLDRKEREMPKDAPPQTRDDAEKQLRQVKGVMEDIYDKQQTLDSMKSVIAELLKRFPDAETKHVIEEQLKTLTDRWAALLSRCKERIAFLESIREFHDTYEHLWTWLVAKEKMMGVLGPIASDPRMVQSQAMQVQVLKDEFKGQEPHLSNLNQNGSKLGEIEGPEGRKIKEKLSAVNQKWESLLNRLLERMQQLDAAAGTSKDFNTILTKLQGNLQEISDAFDDMGPVTGQDADAQLRKLEKLENQLDSQRPLLADCESAGEQLMGVLDDSGAKADVRGKLQQVNRQYSQLQKKIDNRRAELESSLKDEKEFAEAVHNTQAWLQELLGSHTAKLLVSADIDRLRQQVDDYEPVYKETMSREHEVIMLLNRGQDILSRATKASDSRALQKTMDNIQKQWKKLKGDAVERHTRLNTCMEHCKKYHLALDNFLPWLRDTEERIESLSSVSFTKAQLEKQLKDMNSLKMSVSRHSQEYEHVLSLGDTLLSVTDMDKDGVKQELTDLKMRWDALNKGILNRISQLEDVSGRLGKYLESLRDANHSLQRAEDRLKDVPHDHKLLPRIKALQEEAEAIGSAINSVCGQGNKLVVDAQNQGADDYDHIQESMDNLHDRFGTLSQALSDKMNDLSSAQQAVQKFNEDVKKIGHDLSALEEELNKMAPIGRDMKTLYHQTEEIRVFMEKLQDNEADLEDAMRSADELLNEGYSADSKNVKKQLTDLQKQLTRITDRSVTREKDIDQTRQKLEAFYDLHGNVMHELDDALAEQESWKPVGGDVDSIRQQQEEFRDWRRGHIESLRKDVEETNKQGQALAQSAQHGVSTQKLESDLDQMNNKWNQIKEQLAEREHRLDSGLLNSGKFAEALNGLDQWLSDMEEMVSNLKPPSADYNVVRAQIQEHKLLKKMLLDRQPSLHSLFEMGKEVTAHADEHESRNIQEQLHDLSDRFDGLTDAAAARADALEQAMAIAKQWRDKLAPLQSWLGNKEKQLRDMETIPTDEDRIQQRIQEHDVLHDDILSKKPDFDELADVAATVMELVGDDDAQATADKLQEVTDRYSHLVEASEAMGRLLQDSKAGLRQLVLGYEDLLSWLDEMDHRLSKYSVLSVHTDKLVAQMDELAELTEEIADHQKNVDEVVDVGLELMKHISNEEAIQLKDKLDSIQRKYGELTTRAANMLRKARDTLPLVQQFHDSHQNLTEWLLEVEGTLGSLDSASIGDMEMEIQRLEGEIAHYRPMLDTINLVGPQLCSISPGEGASAVEALVTRDNRRFDAVCEQVQRKAERIALNKQRSMEVVGDLDELLEWFAEMENQLKEAEPPSADTDILRIQLKEHRAFSDDISSQKGRVRDVLAAAKKVLREAPPSEDTALLREKTEDLKQSMATVSHLAGDRLSKLEQALPLAEHLYDTHAQLCSWLDDMEQQVDQQSHSMPALRAENIVKQQDKNKAFMQSVHEHKPLLEKLNKTGSTLQRLVGDDDAQKVQDLIDSDNARYANLKGLLRDRQQMLETALQETSQFADKLDGMLAALNSTADQVNNAEPVAAHVEKIQEQITDNNNIVEDLDKREAAFQAVKQAATDVINKAGSRADPAVKDIKKKLDKLNNLWDTITDGTSRRGKSLEEALAVADRFWSELQAVMSALKDLQDTLTHQDPPAVQPEEIQQQQSLLQDIKAEIDQTAPEVEACRQSGQELMSLCGEVEKPEVKKHMEDLDSAWDNVTALYAKREENLIDAMEKAMAFHDTLQNLLEFLDNAEDKISQLGPLAGDIESVKGQIQQLKEFKDEVDPQMVKVEALNRQAVELTSRTSPDQAASIKRPLSEVNRRWDDLLRAIVERQRSLEQALLKLGQFNHALNELLIWIQRTDHTLENDFSPVCGDSQFIEVELAKLKVLVNDISAHQSSVDTLNDAGRALIESDSGSEDASATTMKLNELNHKWDDLQEKAAAKQQELEDALKEAHLFNQEIQDLLLWLSDVDVALTTSKPVGGLPETARDQLNRFMELYSEVEENRPKVEAVLHRGTGYLARASEAGANATNLQHSLKTLKQRWDSVNNRAGDKKIKLEIALREATEFHEALQSFVDWLTQAEKTLSGLAPVSRVMEVILGQIEEHKGFQKEVGTHRETMLSLEKKGTHLKYFSQKQDVILIKNLLISVQHRWERVVSKSAERTRALDHGYKEAKEYNDNYTELMEWLESVEKSLDDLAAHVGNDPGKIKQQLEKHREFQRQLGQKQPSYDHTMKLGRQLKERAPKTDHPALQESMNELKAKWNAVCSKSVDRQRKLEEALLFSGQFKEAVQALLDWLQKIEVDLNNDTPVHGDLDTVSALCDQHKALEEELSNRSAQVESVKHTADELLNNASSEDAATIRQQKQELTRNWDRVNSMAKKRGDRLKGALVQAEELHKAVHALLEWLSDAEMKLRFAGPLPEDEEATQEQIVEHHKFMAEMTLKEKDKDSALKLAQEIFSKCHPDAVTVIKHWMNIIQTRWDEVSGWAKQRQTRLEEHLRALRELSEMLEQLMAWLRDREDELANLEQQPLPDDLETIHQLIEEHQEFQEDMAKREPEINQVCKCKPGGVQPSRRGSKGRRPSKQGSREPSPDLDSPISMHSRKSSYAQSSRETTPAPDSRRARTTPDRETPDKWPHIGPRFASTPVPGRRGSKQSLGSEPVIRNPQARALWDKWRQVWMMAWERQRRLQDKLNYLTELEKVKNFDFEEWRKRFMKWMNNKKSRVMDLFRKMDKDNDGKVPREEFIDGIIKSKFPTSRLEMNAVANVVDANHDSFIDYQEYMSALRPDWESNRPKTVAEQIDDEVKKAVSKCTCRQRFKVHQVGEGKYRFGDSQKLRLVRILRSTVMVRVGGGWVALDEFLVKNDPCRAKGRTNVELREQFVLAEGVSQSMSPFKAKPSPNSSNSSQSGHRSSQSLPTQGPITKVKERTLKSSPMGRSSFSAGTPDTSMSDDYSGGFRLNRKGSAPPPRTPSISIGGIGGGSRPGSRGGSRNGSRPPSRTGSDVSLDSVDGTSSGVRRQHSFSRSTKTSSHSTSSRGSTPGRTTIVVTPLKKTSTPASRGSKDSLTPTTTRTTRLASASSIPSLHSSTNRLHPSSAKKTPKSGLVRPTSTSSIPALLAPNKSGLRSRTPSASSIPGTVASTQRSRSTSSSSNIPQYVGTNRRTTTSGISSASSLTRKGSGASDRGTSARKVGAPGPTRDRSASRLNKKTSG